MHERLDLRRDARDILDARRHAHGDVREGASRGYHPCHGECYDSGKDQSPSLDLLGFQAFGRRILKLKAKRDEDADEGASNRPHKKKNKQRRGGSLVATAHRKGTLNHFERLLEGPCLNHVFPVEHLYKDGSL
jgi:hypothetical protein